MQGTSEFSVGVGYLRDMSVASATQVMSDVVKGMGVTRPPTSWVWLRTPLASSTRPCAISCVAFWPTNTERRTVSYMPRGALVERPLLSARRMPSCRWAGAPLPRSCRPAAERADCA